MERYIITTKHRQRPIGRRWRRERIFTKPPWQTGIGVPQDGVRDVPDISLNASPDHDASLVCARGNCVNGFRDVSSDPNLNNSLTVVGGTSMGAPTFAGIVALINQKMGSSQGNVNPTLYAMAASTPAAFHDITTGNNMVPCTAGSTDCPSSGELGYSATPGYDLASGLGSIDAFNLVTNWSSSSTSNLAAPALSVPSSGATGVSTTATLSWTTVTGNAGYRIMVATSSAVLPTDPTVGTCSGCTINGTTSAASYTPLRVLWPRAPPTTGRCKPCPLPARCMGLGQAFPASPRAVRTSR